MKHEQNWIAHCITLHIIAYGWAIFSKTCLCDIFGNWISNRYGARYHKLWIFIDNLSPLYEHIFLLIAEDFCSEIAVISWDSCWPVGWLHAWQDEMTDIKMAPKLQWRHNECDGVSNYRAVDCLLSPDQRKHQGSALLAFVRGFHRLRTKGQ